MNEQETTRYAETHWLVLGTLFMLCLILLALNAFVVPLIYYESIEAIPQVFKVIVAISISAAVVTFGGLCFAIRVTED